MNTTKYLMYNGLGGIYSAKDVEVKMTNESCENENEKEKEKENYKIPINILPPPNILISINGPEVNSKPSLNEKIKKYKKWIILAGVGIAILIIASTMSNKKAKKIEV